MNRKSHDKGEIRSGFFEKNMGEGGHWRFYRTALATTAGALLTLLAVACTFMPCLMVSSMSEITGPAWYP